MAPPILKMDQIFLTFGGTPLLDGVDLQLEPGNKVSLVGRNGSGKSTLMKIAAGLVESQSGEVFRQPSTTIRYLEQGQDFEDFSSVRDYAESGLGPSDDPHRVTYLLSHLGLTGDESPANLSGGEARRAALARVLAPQPDILLLDEPTNHLDLPTIEWLEGELNRSRGTLMVISHDRRFLENVSNTTIWLDRGRARRLDKGFSSFEAWRDKLLEEEELEHHKLGRQIVREEHWLRYGVTARRKRNMRRLGELQQLRQKHRDHRGPVGTISAQASKAGDSGKLVLEAKSISKAYGDLKLIRDFSLRVQRGDRIGLVGPNGAGKTTLLNLLIGKLEPDQGTIKLGTNLELATLDQKRADLNPNESLAHYLSDGRGDTLQVGGEQRHVTGYIKEFLFQPEQARTPIRELSGGERARLMLAKILARPTNLLILDEPTNDLDMETLDLLQEIVSGFAGTVILVSHDRDFLDRTVTSTLAPANPSHPDGLWIDYAGGYSDMQSQLKETQAERKSGRASNHPKNASATAFPDKPKIRSKLSFKQKYALENLPQKISEVEDQISALEEKMADPRLFADAPDQFAKYAKNLEQLQASLVSMEEEWLELEMLREELEG